MFGQGVAVLGSLKHAQTKVREQKTACPITAGEKGASISDASLDKP